MTIAKDLVEEKKGVVENTAQILTRVFTPLFAAAMVAMVFPPIFSFG